MLCVPTLIVREPARDTPSTNVDTLSTNVDIPRTSRDTPSTNVDIPRTADDALSTNLHPHNFNNCTIYYQSRPIQNREQ
jgi:hypothetical protein